MSSILHLEGRLYTCPLSIPCEHKHTLVFWFVLMADCSINPMYYLRMPQTSIPDWQWELKEYYVIFFIITLDQIIVLNKYCTYNKPIPKILHVKTLQNLCKMRCKKSNKKAQNKLLKVNSSVYISNVDCEAIRARITLKLGGLLRNKSACVEKGWTSSTIS